MTGVILILSALYVNSLVNVLSAAALERSEEASRQVKALVIERLNRTYTPARSPQDFEETKLQWRGVVAGDTDLSETLTNILTQSPGLLEINIAGDDGDILASSNPARSGHPQETLEEFTQWRAKPFHRRLADLVRRPVNFQVVVPLGIGQETIFTIQVITSSVLLRDAALPQLQTVGMVAAAAMLASLLLTMVATGRMLRPIRRIEQTIDQIAQGKFVARSAPEGSASNDPGRQGAREFEAVESKLNALGQQYFGAQQDATNLKHNLDEMVVRMASQLDVASRLAAIMRVSGGVAHEIKNPLNAISLRLDLMRTRMESGNGDNLIPEIEILSKEVHRLDRVVKTFLDFSRPFELSMSDVDLSAVTREVASLMTPQAKACGIEVRLEPARMTAAQAGDFSPAVLAANELRPVWVRGDADLIGQAVINLVTNAIEAMKSGGTLRLWTESVKDSAILEVADTGPGIPESMRGRVFQLYFSTKERGSGMGLAMTYRTAQLHNGTVEFTTEMGRGTLFRLRLPSKASLA